MTTELTTLFDGFSSAEWSMCPGCLPATREGYVYAIVVGNKGSEFPLYVGQSGHLIRRVAEYQYKDFYAATDFRVGEAISYFREVKGHEVSVLFRRSTSPLEEERHVIRELLLQGFSLLNFLAAFDYHKTTPEPERAIVHRFCEMVLRMSQSRLPSSGSASSSDPIA